MSTILLVDDSPDIIDITSRYLTRRGYQVEALSSPIGVRAKIKEVNPAVVVLDIMMPGLTGDRLAQMIKNVSELRKVSIIFYSATPQAEAQLPISLQSITYVHKRQGPAGLAKAIRNVLSED